MKYEETHIEEMLSRFMKAETTLEEERWLADYFSSASSVPQRWHGFAVLFTGIDAGVLDLSDGAQHFPEKSVCSSDACSLSHAEGRRHSRLWLKMTGMTALLCLCFLWGRVFGLKETFTKEQMALVTSGKRLPQLQPSQPQAPSSSQPAVAFQRQVCSADEQRPSAVWTKADASRRTVPSEKQTTRGECESSTATAGSEDISQEASDEKPAQPHLAQTDSQPAPLQENDLSDLSAHILSAAFTYPEHSELDERAIQKRNRVRAEILEQYAHIGF